MTGAEFRALRRELGLTVEGMARAMGMAGSGSDRTIRRWQVAGPPPPAAVAVALLVALRRCHDPAAAKQIADAAAAIATAAAEIVASR